MTEEQRQRHNEYMRKYYREHKEQIRLNQKKYRLSREETEVERENKKLYCREYYYRVTRNNVKVDKRKERRREPINSIDEKLIEKYSDYCLYEKSLSAKTVKTTAAVLRQYSREYLTPKNTCYVKLTENDINDILIDIIKKHNAKLRNAALQRFRTFYKFLIKRDIIKVNPCENIEKAKEAIRLREELTPTNQNKLLSVLPKYDIRDQVMIHIFLNTGCRLSELINMKMDDIDMDDRFIRVIGKRNKERYIPINDFLFDKLTQFIKYREENKIDYSDYVMYRLGRLYNEDENRPIDQCTVNRVFEKLKKDTKITQPLSPHVLRHTFATNLVNKDLDIQIISNILGHDSLDTTMIYAKSNKYRNRDKFININMY